MKALKDNYLVKTVYAYLDLFYKAFPFFFILFYLPQLFIPSSESKISSIDTFGFFKFLDSSIEVTSLLKYLVVAINVLIAVGVFIVLKKLTVFIRNTFEGNPYCEENGKNLKFVGFLIAAYTVLLQIAIGASAVWLKNDSVIKAGTKLLIQIANIIGIIFNPYFVLGLFVIVLGEIIIHGAKIKQENDLTV